MLCKQVDMKPLTNVKFHWHPLTLKDFALVNASNTQLHTLKNYKLQTTNTLQKVILFNQIMNKLKGIYWTPSIRFPAAINGFLSLPPRPEQCGHPLNFLFSGRTGGCYLRVGGGGGGENMTIIFISC